MGVIFFQTLIIMQISWIYMLPIFQMDLRSEKLVPWAQTNKECVFTLIFCRLLRFLAALFFVLKYVFSYSSGPIMVTQPSYLFPACLTAIPLTDLLTKKYVWNYSHFECKWQHNTKCLGRHVWKKDLGLNIALADNIMFPCPVQPPMLYIKMCVFKFSFRFRVAALEIWCTTFRKFEKRVLKVCEACIAV